MMIPAPKNPMPETIWAATRDGSSTTAAGQDVAEAVLTDQQNQRRRRADDGLRAQTRAFALDGALQTDEGGQRERGEKLDQVSAVLRRASEQRVGQPDLHVRQANPPRTIQRVDLMTCE
jgi:hypothetical protein